MADNISNEAGLSSSPTKATKKLKTCDLNELKNDERQVELQKSGKTDDNNDDQDSTTPKFEFSREPSLETIRKRTEEFAAERNWQQYHTPRNLMLGK